MTQVEDGIWTLDERMPCEPSELNIQPYVLPQMPGSTEALEMIARLLSFSSQKNMWVGVSERRIWQQAYEEVVQYQNAWDAYQRDEEKRRSEFRRAQARYHRLCLLTLGLYMPLAKMEGWKPGFVNPVFDPKQYGVRVVSTLLSLTGSRMKLESALRELVRQKVITKLADLYFPTPTLVEEVLTAEGRRRPLDLSSLDID